MHVCGYYLFITINWAFPAASLFQAEEKVEELSKALMVATKSLAEAEDQREKFKFEGSQVTKLLVMILFIYDPTNISAFWCLALLIIAVIFVQ